MCTPNLMPNILKKIRKIILVDDAGNFPLAKKVVERAGVADVVHFSEKEYNNYLTELPLKHSAEILALKSFPGSFARKCPGTKEPYLCCEYEILSPVVNCPIGCSYCILQCYLNEPVNIIYVNVEKIFDDALERYKDFPEDKIVRVGTGELGDSLVFEEWTNMGETLIEKFARQKNIILELKTKSVNMGNILKKFSPGNIVLSWSLNPPEITKTEEGLAAKIDDRINTAAHAIERGYLVGFHFDPMIYHERGRKIYGKVIEKIKEKINPEKIAWISLGTLRYPKEMPPIAKNNHPKSSIFSREFIKGLDGKWRYPKPRRIEIYNWAAKPLREWSDKFFLYFCMELPDVWHEVLGWAPENNQEFDEKFGNAVINKTIF